ncbi:hypothetical protein PPERSA_06227 [Pseudocohnilembus persalinus]|uniref:EF-hand domain-containing protein n=1 Tax=Pseudocohnilembus persalinus TaxID=266149 RepID=A0A0V0R0R3_PSEPJ|nr:hypothetical protein PPERSA_06227 [Pseudocohnilembus persalinus]|eukprot:KRX08049.1 hypothetical protein PPERSA_06227 [Pseudocohnilembus persalinus]
MEEDEAQKTIAKQENKIFEKKTLPPQKKIKERGAIWRSQNREHANYEHDFKKYLQEKAENIENQVNKKPPQKYKPIIIKTNDKTEYEKGVDDSEIGSDYSELSDFAYETAADIMNAYKNVFEYQDKQDEIRRLRIKDFKDDEIFLLVNFYKKLREKSCQDEGLSKEELEKGLLTHAHVMQLYNISPANLNKELEELETKKMNIVSRQEMITFLLNPNRPMLQDFDFEAAESLLHNRRKPEIQKEFILSENDFQKITNVFLNIDTFGDHKVQVKQLIHYLKRDPEVKQILGKPAIYINAVKKEISVDRLLMELEQEMYFAPSKEIRQQKSTITWDDFILFFQNYERRVIPSKDEIIKANRLTGKFESGDVIELPKEFIKLLKDLYEELDKHCECFVRKFEFCDELRLHNDFKQWKNEKVREQEFFEHPVETVEQTVERIIREGDEFLDLDDIIDFFTRKGRPILIEKALQDQRENFRKSKALAQWNREDFSSPDEDEIKEKRRQRKIEKIKGVSNEIKAKQRQKLKQKENDIIHGKPFGALYKDSDKGFKITVPEPYKFDKREKNRKEFIVERRLKEDLQKAKEQEDAIVKIPGTFRANKIPKHVKDRHLLEKIEHAQEKRREQVRQQSKQMTKLNENPFSFYYRDQDKEHKYHCFDPNEEEVKQFEHFHANPAPWYTRVLMLERMYKEKEEKSRAYVQKRMKELQQMSKLPKSVKNMMTRLAAKEQERKSKMNNFTHGEFTFQPPKAKPIPDFERLHQEFQESLDSVKQNKALTQPIEFNFQETRKAPKRDYLDKENALMKQTKEIPAAWGKREKKITKIKNVPPKYYPPSTKKFEAMVEKRKQDEEIKMLQEQLKDQREYEKEIRRQQFAKFVRYSGAIYDNTQNLEQARNDKIRQRRMEEKAWEQHFDQLMTDMMKRVIRRPLLVESFTNDNYSEDRVQRLKWLLGQGNIEEQPEDEEQETDNENQQQQYYQQQDDQQQMDPQMQYELQQQQQWAQQQQNQYPEGYDQQQDEQEMNQMQQEVQDQQYNPQQYYMDEQQQEQYMQQQQLQQDYDQDQEQQNGQEEIDQFQQQDLNAQQQQQYQQQLLNQQQLQIQQQQLQQQQQEQEQEEQEEEENQEAQQQEGEEIELLQQQQDQDQQEQDQYDEQEPQLYMEGEQREEIGDQEGDQQEEYMDSEERARNEQIELQRQQLQQQEMLQQQQQQQQWYEGEEQGEGEEYEGEEFIDGELNYDDPEQRAQVIALLRQQGYEIGSEEDEDEDGEQEQYMEQHGGQQQEDGEYEEYNQEEQLGQQRQHSF